MTTREHQKLATGKAAVKGSIKIQTKVLMLNTFKGQYLGSPKALEDLQKIKAYIIENSFYTFQIKNFKTNDRTFYLFPFDGEKLIANADLKTAASEQNVIRTLNAL